jgi:hypothetical protein
MAKPRSRKSSSSPSRRVLILSAVLLLLLAFVLAWVSNRFASFSGWFSFTAMLALCTGLFYLSWRLLRAEKPPAWLLALTIGAALFRLALGLLWFLALPVGGYDTDVQEAGYVMQDAFNRDGAAFQLGRSAQPLTLAFQGFSGSDQYGGLLFVSAAVYRYIGTAQHQPLLVLTLAAAVSALAVMFTWAFVNRAWAAPIARLAAWGLALYPEAALLGSSQMREAFTVTFLPLALFALFRLHKKFSWANLALLTLPILLSVPLSRAFTPSLLLVLALAYLGLDKWRVLRNRYVLGGLAALVVLAVIAVFLFVDVGSLWLVQSADWQTYVSANASDWVTRQFDRMPVWGQVPFLVIYGIFRPLLPAALVASGPPIWTAMGIWRALGWTALLGLLVYATYLAFRSKAWRQLPGALLLANWIVSFTVSYRAGGDLWDNPRYRSAFAAIQVAVAAWAWVTHRETKDPWLRRALGSMIFIIAWFIPWYLRRYAPFDWPIVELHQVIGLGLVSASLYILWDWLRS